MFFSFFFLYFFSEAFENTYKQQSHSGKPESSIQPNKVSTCVFDSASTTPYSKCAVCLLVCSTNHVASSPSSEMN